MAVKRSGEPTDWRGCSGEYLVTSGLETNAGEEDTSPYLSVLNCAEQTGTNNRDKEI